MKVLALELAPHQIRVNTVHPPTVNTDMVLNEPTYTLFCPHLERPTRADYKVSARHLNRLPTAGLEVDDVSDAISYLVSDAGRYVTGTTHVVDCGALLRWV
jgi:NAD(P)-dependent dehydrogenase (short-subunit alcohol dehydrogenase family)